MKRISLLLVTLALCAAPAARAQDAATEERLNKLSGRLDDLSERQEALNKSIQALSRDIRSLQEQAGKQPAGNYASEEDAKRLKSAIEEVDRKRLQDAETVKAQLEGLRKALLNAPLPKSRTPTSTPVPENPHTSKGGDETGFEYIIKAGDNPSTIIQALKSQNPPIKISLDALLKANPGLKPDKLKVGQKIFIPSPQ